MLTNAKSWCFGHRLWKHAVKGVNRHPTFSLLDGAQIPHAQAP